MADGPDSAARRESKLGIRLGDEIRTRRIDARMRKARCRPFHSWDCHIANHSPSTARKATNQTRNSAAGPGKNKPLGVVKVPRPIPRASPLLLRHQ
jgi:hypothetical protein